jgi:hypothetical protein
MRIRDAVEATHTRGTRPTTGKALALAWLLPLVLPLVCFYFFPFVPSLLLADTGARDADKGVEQSDLCVS